MEEYAKEKYGDNWTKAAQNLAKELTLDKNNALTFTQIIEAPEKSREELYITINYWYTNTFNSGDATIEFNDKESGVIIAKGFIEEVASHTGGMNTYTINITPIIRTDIKDGKVRVIYTLPFYMASVLNGGILFGTRNATAKTENWVLDECFPFTKKDKHKKTSAKALVMAYAYSNVIMDKIEEAIKNGMVGDEDDNW